MDIEGKRVPFGTDLLFVCEEVPELVAAAEICEDLWVTLPPSVLHAQAGANLIVNLSASNEMVGKDSYRRNLVSGQSARLVCGYVYANAGEGESTQDLVFGGQNMIAENEVFSLRDLPLSGKDLIEAGIPEGPAIGEALEAAFQEVVEERLSLDHDALLAFALSFHKR